MQYESFHLELDAQQNMSTAPLHHVSRNNNQLRL